VTHAADCHDWGLCPVLEGMTIKIEITTGSRHSRPTFVDRVRTVARRGRTSRAHVSRTETPAPPREDATARYADPLALDPYSPIG